MTEWLLRFAIGGAVVSMFSVIGEMWQPKRFAGIFGAAPAVALGTLALAFASKGPAYVHIECEGMLAGAVALLCYGGICVWAAEARSIPVWLGAASAWLAWLLFAAGAFWIGHRLLGLA